MGRTKTSRRNESPELTGVDCPQRSGRICRDRPFLGLSLDTGGRKDLPNVDVGVVETKRNDTGSNRVSKQVRRVGLDPGRTRRGVGRSQD